MSNIKKKKIKNKKGFSILEVLLAAFLISVGIITVINLLGKTLVTATDSRNHVIATSLAQEGVELVHNIRDNNAVTGNDSFDGFSDGDCKIDYDDSDCSGSGEVLRYGGGFYNHDTGNDTIFSRQIIISGSGGDEMEVISMVIWSGTSFPSESGCTSAKKCVLAKSVLTKWRE